MSQDYIRVVAEWVKQDRHEETDWRELIADIAMPCQEPAQTNLLTRMRSVVAVPEDHVYTWTIKPGSLWYKYYAFVWGQEATKAITFCKIAWTVILWPVFVWLRPGKMRKRKPSVRETDTPEYKAHARHDFRHSKARARVGKPEEGCTYCERLDWQLSAHERRMDRSDKVIAWSSARADRVGAFFQVPAVAATTKVIGRGIHYICLPIGSAILGTASGIRWFAKSALPDIATVLGLAMLASLAGWAIYLLVQHPVAGLEGIGVVVGGVAAVFTALAIVAGLNILFWEHKVYDERSGKHYRRIEYYWDLRLYPALCWVGRCIEHGSGFFAAFYHMVKYRTCPRVLVEDPSAAHADRVLERVRRQVVEEYSQ